MSCSADFIAELKYLTTEEGGRATPARSGYRPQLKFGFAEMQTSGRQIFIGRDMVYPGEKVIAEITIIAVPFFAGKLYSGLQFEFREGARIIGTGTITNILNKDLER
ncbi:elongation factor Tu [Mucilaginibacter sp. HC2]|uniref:EF-Tu C-terminal domain-related protein n=1 Tax=Mucilaginibacter inviolabilis TaxID=2714892 RepID=UPI001408F070|nr:elongation factor Tu [Mucilaginibacter inviolabilis]NHA05719.1 elongation factor Tu [Mucilaginibacter inviolabilis]